MNITVFGATGVIGSLTVNELLTHGHTITAYARNIKKVPAIWDGQVRVVIGEMSNSIAIDVAVRGADAVVSALGPSMDRKAVGLPLVEGTQHILTAMKRHGATRFIGHGTPSLADPDEERTMQTRLISFLGRTFLRRAYDELTGVSDLIMRSGLDWTIVRFTAPTDGEKTGKVRAGFYGTDRIGFQITRADIAAFTAAQVDSHLYVCRVPAISN